MFQNVPLLPPLLGYMRTLQFGILQQKDSDFHFQKENMLLGYTYYQIARKPGEHAFQHQSFGRKK